MAYEAHDIVRSAAIQHIRTLRREGHAADKAGRHSQAQALFAQAKEILDALKETEYMMEKITSPDKAITLTFIDVYDADGKHYIFDEGDNGAQAYGPFDTYDEAAHKLATLRGRTTR